MKVKLARAPRREGVIDRLMVQEVGAGKVMGWGEVATYSRQLSVFTSNEKIQSFINFNRLKQFPRDDENTLVYILPLVGVISPLGLTTEFVKTTSISPASLLPGGGNKNKLEGGIRRNFNGDLVGFVGLLVGKAHCAH